MDRCLVLLIVRVSNDTLTTMVAENDIIVQKRMQLEDFAFMPFFEKVIEDYGFKPFGAFSEIRSRIVEYGMESKPHPTDDKIHQFLLQDCLVAMVYERRTDFNFIEATYIICASGIRLAKRRLDIYYKTLKKRK